MATPDLHLTELMAGSLEALGWDLAASPIRDVVPTVVRGHNLVVVAPPAPVHATPVLAGMLSRPDGEGTILVLAPSASLTEWSTPVAALAGEARRPLVVLPGGQAKVRRDSPPGLLVAGPETALDLHRRSVLPTAAIRAVLIAWPEYWEDRETLTLLLPDLPPEAQRVVITSAPDRIADLLDRHVWRALTIGDPFVPQIAPLTVVPVAWSRRVSALAELASEFDVPSLTIWTADTSHHAEIRRALAGSGMPVELTCGDPAPAAALIAFDLPAPGRLARLAAAGRLFLLMPPGTEPWVTAVAPERQPHLLPGELQAAASEAARRRAVVERTIRDGDLGDTLVGMAPLFERHDPATVAAALYQLWTRAPRQPVAPAVAPSRGVARVWLGAGRRDSIGPNDIVGLLVNELKLDRAQIGRIDLRESFALVEVPAEDADRIAEALAGRTLKRRRITARVDRGERRPPRAPRR